MKKILYVTNISRTVNTFFIPHMNMLIENGYAVDCACKIEGEHKLYKEKIDENIGFYDLPFTRNPLNIKNMVALYRLYKLQKENKYDIIHVHTPIAAAYTRLLKIAFKDVKIIYTAHGYHFYKGSSKLMWIIFYNIENYLSKYTDVLITINSEDYEASKEFKCKRLLKMNGVGVDFKEFKENSIEEKIKIRESIDIRNDDFILIMVGEHNRNKNQIQLIKSIQHLEKKYPKIKAIFIGDGESIEENKEYVEKNNVENVKILGFRKNVNELINASDILVSLSHREGLPKNIIEGMICGKPIIATNVRGNRDLVEDSVNGYIVDVGNIDATIEIIDKMYKNKKEIENMSCESKRLAEKYKIEIIEKSLLEVYKDV